MKKKLLMLIVLFLAPIVVSAKSVIKTCTYSGDDGALGSGSSSLEVRIYDDYSADSTITMFDGDSENDDEDILNWSELKSKFKSTKKCPNFSLIGWKDGFLFFNSYEVYLSYERNLTKYTVKGDDVVFDKTSQGTSNEYKNSSAGKKENEAQKKYCQDYLKSIKSYEEKMKNFSITSCEDTNRDFISRYSKCKDQLTSALNGCNAQTSKLDKECLKDGYITNQELTDAEGVCSNIGDYVKDQLKGIKVLEDELEQGKKERKYPSFYNTKIQYRKCGSLDHIPKYLPVFSNAIYRTIKFMVPIILILMGVLDFAKAVMSKDEAEMSEKKNKFIRRIVAAILVFFTLSFVQFLVGLTGSADESTSSCVDCFINNANKCETYTFSEGK